MITRRVALGAMASLLAPGLARPADLSPRFTPEAEAARNCATDRFADAVVPFGAVLLPGNDPRWAKARNFLNSAPRSTPYAVARYLEGLPWEFKHQWTTQLANPLIVLLFRDLGLTPSGDTIAWCAVFTNWCLDRCGLTGTGSAWAQSFVGWGTPVWSFGQSGLHTKARAGDVAVFQLRANTARGHVGFVVDVPGNETTVDTLGGNQTVMMNGDQIAAINVKAIDIRCKYKLLQVRRG